MVGLNIPTDRQMKVNPFQRVLSRTIWNCSKIPIIYHGCRYFWVHDSTTLHFPLIWSKMTKKERYDRAFLRNDRTLVSTFLWHSERG
jgi:hypothetical protein